MRRKNSNNFPIHKTFNAFFAVIAAFRMVYIISADTFPHPDRKRVSPPRRGYLIFRNISIGGLLNVGIQCTPLCYGRKYAKSDDLVAHLAQVLN